MEASALFACLSFLGAFFAALFLAYPLLVFIRGRRVVSKTQSRALAQDTAWMDGGRQAAGVKSRALTRDAAWTGVVRNGVPFCKPPAGMILNFTRVEAFLEDGVNFLFSRGIRTTVVNLGSLCIAGLSLVFVLALLISNSPVFALLVPLCLTFLAKMLLTREKERRASALRESIPDALRSMSVCFGAGLSLFQTFSQVAEEIDGPLRTIFLNAADEISAGNTTSDALEMFRMTSIDELSFIAVALDIRHRVGGSIRRVLDAARESVESEIELRRSLKVQTAQAKMSANVVSIMPLILVAVFSFISEGFLMPFFESPMGLMLLGAAILMQVGGILLVRKMLAIEVS